VKFAVGGLPLAVSMTLSVAARGPVADGVNITPIVQVAPAASELPQVVTSAKSPELVPAIASPEMPKEVLLLLLTVIVWSALEVATGWLPKERLAGERPIPAGAAPVPERATLWGLPLALSLTLTDAVRVPLAVGVKVTLIVHVFPAATELPQVLIWAKSPALVPVIVILVMLKGALPVLPRLTVWAALVVPTAWLAKVRMADDKPAAGAVPVPDRATVWGLPLALSLMLSEAVRLPLAVGVKVTLIVHEASTVTEMLQVLVSAKSPALVPVIATLAISKMPMPTFMTVTV